MRPTRRGVVISLALFSGLAGELVAAASMTRIAGPADLTGGRLGFPTVPFDLRWTLFAVVSIAGWVGAILWTSGRARDRKAGRFVNLVASALAGAAVGLDHAVHASPTPTWRIVAFCVGVAMPLFSSIMVHLIAGMVADQPSANRSRAPRTVAAPPPSGTPVRDTPSPASPPNGRVIPIGVHKDRPEPAAGSTQGDRQAFAHAWLAENWTPTTQPNDLVQAAAGKHWDGRTIDRQYAWRQLDKFQRARPMASANG